MKKKKKMQRKIDRITENIVDIIMLFTLIEASKIDKSRHNSLLTRRKIRQK